MVDIFILALLFLFEPLFFNSENLATLTSISIYLALTIEMSILQLSMFVCLFLNNENSITDIY